MVLLFCFGLFTLFREGFESFAAGGCNDYVASFANKQIGVFTFHYWCCFNWTRHSRSLRAAPNLILEYPLGVAANELLILLS